MLKTKKFVDLSSDRGSKAVCDRYIPNLIIIVGVCLCDEGYNGDDCLEESSKPPSNIEIPANGLCGTRERECRRTNVYGMFNAKIVWCRRRHFQVYMPV